MNGRLRRLLLDTTPLRLDRDFRWLWAGQTVNGLGTQITRLALPFQVYLLTGSTLAIAALTAFQLVPILVFALGAGALADAVDRRRLLILTQAGLCVSSLGLFALATMDAPPLLAIYALAFIAAGLSTVDHPARTSSVPRLVPTTRLPAALALNSLNTQAASIVGPAVGGILIATVGLAAAYAVDALTFVASLFALSRMRPIPAAVDARRPSLAGIREGLGFVRRRPPVLGTFVIDLIAMVLARPVALFPILALDVFRVGAVGFGFMASAPAVGAFLAALLSGWVGRVRPVGRAVVAAVLVWGLATLGFGLAAWLGGPAAFVVGLVMLAVAGASDMLSAVFRNMIVQLATPDELRGRVSSIHILVVTAGPRAGDLQASILAAVLGPAVTVVLGGALCVSGVLAMRNRFPQLGRHVLDRTPGADPR